MGKFGVSGMAVFATSKWKKKKNQPHNEEAEQDIEISENGSVISSQEEQGKIVLEKRKSKRESFRKFFSNRFDKQQEFESQEIDDQQIVDPTQKEEAVPVNKTTGKRKSKRESFRKFISMRFGTDKKSFRRRAETGESVSLQDPNEVPHINLEEAEEAIKEDLGFLTDVQNLIQVIHSTGWNRELIENSNLDLKPLLEDLTFRAAVISFISNNSTSKMTSKVFETKTTKLRKSFGDLAPGRTIFAAVTVLLIASQECGAFKPMTGLRPFSPKESLSEISIGLLSFLSDLGLCFGLLSAAGVFQLSKLDFVFDKSGKESNVLLTQATKELHRRTKSASPSHDDVDDDVDENVDQDVPPLEPFENDEMVDEEKQIENVENRTKIINSNQEESSTRMIERQLSAFCEPDGADFASLPPPPPELYSPKKGHSPREKVVVVHTYRPSKSTDLSLHQGDRIEVLESFEDGWVRGRLCSSDGVVEGEFPSNYVRTEDSTTQHIVVDSILNVIETSGESGISSLRQLFSGMDEALATQQPLNVAISRT